MSYRVMTERKEVIVKLVNAEAGNWKVRLQLDKAKNLASKGTKIVLGGDDRFDENSFSDPLKIVRKSPSYRELAMNLLLIVRPIR